MKKIITLFFFLIASKAFCAPAPEILEEKQGSITNYYPKVEFALALREYNNLDWEQKQKFIKYRLENQQELYPILLAAFADDIFPSNNSLAALMFVIGYLRTMQDSAMCEDSTSKDLAQSYPIMAYQTVAYISSLDEKNLKKLFEAAAAWDKRNTVRPNYIWACYGGMGVFSGNEVTTIDDKYYKSILKSARKSLIKAAKNH